MKFIGIIPARYASTRFPGKPLAMLGGKTMIERVYTQARLELDEVVVATDDDRIAGAVESFGGVAVMTSPAHRSGTDRCCEAFDSVGSDADVVINIQGDDPSTDIATLVRRFDPKRGFDALFDPNTPKVVMDDAGHALYFSRSIIPYVRGHEWKEWLDNAVFHTHVGIYAYRTKVLHEIVCLPQSPLELAESLEQLRWLQAGYRITTAVTDCETIGIDTPDDLRHAEGLLTNLGK